MFCKRLRSSFLFYCQVDEGDLHTYVYYIKSAHYLHKICLACFIHFALLHWYMYSRFNFIYLSGKGRHGLGFKFMFMNDGRGWGQGMDSVTGGYTIMNTQG